MFWPGAVVGSYGGFMASSFVVGFGLAVLETAANPFLILCGPPEYADARLLLAQAVQAVGSVLSGLLADRVFFAARLEKGHTDSASSSSSSSSSTILIEVQWTYLAITLSSVLLALFFYYMPLPEVTDADLALSAARRARSLPVAPDRKSVAGISLRTWALGLAVLAQWCYVSAQENMSLFFEQLITAFVTPANGDRDAALASPQEGGAAGSRPAGLALSLPNYLFVAHTAFAVSRFLAAGVCIFAVQREQNKPPSPQAPSPHSPPLPDDNLTPNPHNNPPKSTSTNTPLTLLTLSITLSTLSLLTALVLPPATTNPNLAAIPILLFFFFEGPIWPLIFSLGLRGQGVRTKQAAAWLTMGGCGPGVWPFVSWGVMQRGQGNNVQVSLVVVVVLMAVAGVYPGFLVVVKGGREMVGVQMPEKLRRGERQERSGRGGDDDDDDTSDRNGDGNGNGNGNGNETDDDDDDDNDRNDNDNTSTTSSSSSPNDIEQTQQHNSKNRGSLSQHLFPGWPHHNNSTRSTRSSQQPQQSQSRQGQEKEKEDAPWESQVLDTSMLRDMP